MEGHINLQLVTNKFLLVNLFAGIYSIPCTTLTFQTNTFQCVLTTDGVTSFVLFLYADDGIEWTTGDNSDGNGGLGGTPALVGVNAGDGMQSSSVSESLTAAIINIDTTSNVDRPGLWLFQVNEIDEDSSMFLGIIIHTISTVFT